MAKPILIGRMIISEQAAMTQHNIGFSGGNDISRFYASAGYMDQQGTTPTVGYRRYNFRINSDHNISKVFTFGENLYTCLWRSGL